MLPPNYFTPDTNHPNKPTDPCDADTNANGSESKFGPTGLDNDGDIARDGSDPDCGVANTPPQVDPINNQTNDENQSVNLAVIATDPDGDTLSYSATGLPPGLTIDSTTGVISGTISFDAVVHPNTSQVYNVTVNVSDGTDTTPETFVWTVNDVNRAPVATNDSAATLQDQPVTVNVLANDSDADGDTLTISAFDAASANGGTVSCTTTCDYLPATGYVGTDTFTYTINDGYGGSDTATVTVTVANVNDPPTVDDPGAQANLETDTVSLQIVASDVDGPNPLSYSATGLPPTLGINPSTGLISGTVSYDAVGHPDLSAVYPVTVSVNDGLATTSVSFDWTINDVNRIPVAVDDSATTLHDVAVTISVVANDSDPDGDVLTISAFDAVSANGGTVSCTTTCDYTPAAGFVGTDTFTYAVVDGFGGSATATVTVDVTNEAPVAVDNVYSTQQDTPLNVPAPGVLANDSDADGDPLSAVPGTPPANGSLTLTPDGSFSYTPDAGFNGPDTFTYFATDGIANSNEATVTINVSVVNLPPEVTNPGAQSSAEGDSVTLQVVASDPDGDTLGYSATGLPPNLMIDANTGLISGNVSFDAVAHPDLSAVYPVTVEVTDGTNPAQTVSFNWTVSDTNRDPIAVDDPATTQTDTSVTVDVLANDMDPDGDALTVAAITVPGNGTAAINPDGTVTYTPNNGISGTDSFDYTVVDGFGGSATATVTVTVVAGPVADVYLTRLQTPSRVNGRVGDAPVKSVTARGDGDTVAQDATVLLSVLSQPPFVTVVVSPASLTDVVVPGNPETQFRPYIVFYNCTAPGTGTVTMQASIDAVQNSDATNDAVTATTEVTCR